MTGLAALRPIHATLERETVALMTSVLETWFVEQTTVLGILAWIVAPPLPLLLAILTVALTGWR